MIETMKDAFIKSAIRIETMAAIIQSGAITQEYLQSRVDRAVQDMWNRLSDIRQAHPEYYNSLQEPIVDLRPPGQELVLGDPEE